MADEAGVTTTLRCDGGATIVGVDSQLQPTITSTLNSAKRRVEDMGPFLES
jgi:hypothetical protein